MNGRLDYPLYSSGSHAPEEIDSLLHAASSFSRQFDLDPDDVLREIALTLNRRVEFDVLRKRFGVSLPKQ